MDLIHHHFLQNSPPRDKSPLLPVGFNTLKAPGFFLWTYLVPLVILTEYPFDS